MSSTEWLSLSEYAETYGVTRPTVYKWMDAGILIDREDYYRVTLNGISVIRIYNRLPRSRPLSTSASSC